MPHIPGEGNGDTLQYSGLEDFVQRSLAGYSPWSFTELDVTEWLTHTHTPYVWNSPGGLAVRNPPAMQETQETWV